MDGFSAVVGYFNGHVVAASDKKLTIMNESLGIIKEFAGTTHRVRSVCGNSAYLAVCDYGGAVWYYKRDSDAEPKVIIFANSVALFCFKIYKHHRMAASVQVKNNLVISASFDKTVQVWNMERHEKLWEFDHGDKVWSLTLRDNQVITCCGDKSVRVLALESGKELHRLEHPGACKNADLSPNQSLLAVACYSAVILWDIREGKFNKIEQFDLGPKINDLRFNPTGDKIIVGSFGGEIYEIELH